MQRKSHIRPDALRRTGATGAREGVPGLAGVRWCCKRGNRSIGLVPLKGATVQALLVGGFGDAAGNGPFLGDEELWHCEGY